MTISLLRRNIQLSLSRNSHPSKRILTILTNNEYFCNRFIYNTLEMLGKNVRRNKRKISSDEANVQYNCSNQRLWPPAIPNYMDFSNMPNQGRGMGPSSHLPYHMLPGHSQQISKYNDVNCGELRHRDDGMKVRMSGKVNKARVGRFLEIKDIRGITQLVARDDKPHIALKFQSIPIDSYITILGTCQLRPINFRNNSISTGSIEVVVEEIVKVILPLGKSTPLTANISIPHQSVQKQQCRGLSDLRMRGITSVEYKRVTSENILKYFINRQATCGELRIDDVGRTVTLVGWLDSKKHGRFLQLKDGYGQTQIIIDSEDSGIRETVAAVKDDSIVLAKGRVIARPPSNQHNSSETGEIEVFVEEFRILDPNEEFNESACGLTRNSTMEVDVSNNAEDMPVAPKSPVPKYNKYTYRTYNCGELNESNIGEEVVLTGWLEFQRMKKFFTLRDGYGVTQIIIPDDLSNSIEIDSIPFESVLKVMGVVMARPPGMKNDSMSTGSIEVVIKSLQVLNEAKKNLPIEMRNHNRSKELLRMEYRYIDLRFPDMQKNLRTRSKVLMKMREYLINQCGFIEVETPTLFRRTPGGAQEFVVPTRKAGKFYSLVQSPQQFKQMLMAGAIDRYFQIARCYRDESTRPDRQPEFTQLDIELSFSDRENIMALIEAILVNCWPESNGTLTIPFPKITYQEAMEKYGSDKPDTRFDLPLSNITKLVSLNDSFTENVGNFASYAIVLKHPKSSITNATRNSIKTIAKDYDCKLVISKLAVNSVMDWVKGPVKKALSEVVAKALAADLHLEPNDLLILAHGEKNDCLSLMGKVRLDVQNDLEERKLVPTRSNYDYKFLWVVDFPMFSLNEETKEIESTHHPFTAPHPDDEHLLEKPDEWFNMRSLAYDLVLNGQEIGGGSIRIHNPQMQKMVLDDILKIKYEHLSHMIDALGSGCPPHGGIALGIDRLMSIICNTKTIRDVIAFPKGLEGKDHLSKAPVEISDEEKQLYHIKILEATTTDDNKPSETEQKLDSESIVVENDNEKEPLRSNQ